MYRAEIQHGTRYKIYDENEMPIGIIFKRNNEWIFESDDVSLSLTDLKELVVFIGSTI